jgi:hypothetical protein
LFGKKFIFIVEGFYSAPFDYRLRRFERGAEGARSGAIHGKTDESLRARPLVAPRR